jgi:hypothetical protein
MNQRFYAFLRMCSRYMAVLLLFSLFLALTHLLLRGSPYPMHFVGWVAAGFYTALHALWMIEILIFFWQDVRDAFPRRSPR